MKKQPNILYIMTDQQRYDCIAALGNPVILTPNLDQLVYDGVTFSSAYADCPICIPSRTTVISGLHAYSYGRTGWHEEPFNIKRENTFLSLLTENGYRTHIVGKTHFFPQGDGWGAESQELYEDGYEKMLCEEGYASLSNFIGSNNWAPCKGTIPEHLRRPVWTVDRAVDFIDRHDGSNPFFLWVSFFDPHCPSDPSEAYESIYRNAPMPAVADGDWMHDGTEPFAHQYHRQTFKSDTLPPYAVDLTRRYYYGMISEIDFQLGRLMSKMKKEKLMDDTIIIFTTDHGDMMGDHGDFHKSMFYEGAAHVPVIIRYPDQTPGVEQGASIDTPVCLCDVYNTILGFADITPPAPVDGIDLNPIARGDKSQARRWVIGECSQGGRQHMVTDGKWKYLYFEWGGVEQLFHLESDPQENHDLSKKTQCQNQKAEMKQALIDSLKQRKYPLDNGELPVSQKAFYTTRHMRQTQGYWD